MYSRATSEVLQHVCASLTAPRASVARSASSTSPAPITLVWQQILSEFLQQEPGPSLDAVCLAIAGPVRSTATGQSAKVTNLPWEIDGGALAQIFSFPRLHLINDFEAIGYGFPMLGAGDFVVLQKGDPVPRGPRALIGAGTGLGQAILSLAG